MFNNVDWKDVAIRCLKTFVEVFLGYIVTCVSGTIDLGSIDKAAAVGAIVCGASTALTAVINGILIPIFKHEPEMI